MIYPTPASADPDRLMLNENLVNTDNKPNINDCPVYTDFDPADQIQQSQADIDDNRQVYS